MKKRTKVIIIVSLVIIILAVLIYMYVSSFKVDKEKTLKLMNEVSEDYPAFNKAMNEFVNKRNSFYKQKEEIYLDDINKDPSKWSNFMTEYAKIVNTVEDKSSRLKSACKNDFGDIGAKTKCNEFRVNYEAAMNYYITDVKVYNKIVKEYNQWLINNNNLANKLTEVKLSIYKDYIDYDKDGEYFGKGEDK